MIKYEVIIYWSEEDQAFIAEVPEWPGCMADGKTSRKALANVEVIAREWIETAHEWGQKPRTRRQVRLRLGIVISYYTRYNVNPSGG